MNLRAFLATALFLPMSLFADPLELGAPIPDITATDDAGNAVALREAGATGLTFVFFYPRANTPGCTAQACSLRDAFADLTDKGVRVFGVSRDTVAAQHAFRTEHNLPYPLLADPEGRVVEAFGVPSMGNFARRQAFLFRDGVLVWKDESASTSQQAADLVAAVAGLR